MKHLVRAFALFVAIATVSNLYAINADVFSIDFDQSMGKNDAYMHKYYDLFLKDLNSPVQCQYLEPYSRVYLLDFCKKLYEQNKPSAIISRSGGISQTARIPQVFHQIWIGTKPLPQKYKMWQKKWLSVPGWRYKLWTDKDVEKLNLFNKDIYFKEKNLGARADILRIEILYRFGGVYIDTDFELLDPEFFNFANKTYDFYCGLTPIDSWQHWNFFGLNNAIIGSIPGHPILKTHIENRKFICPQTETVQKGPGYFTKIVLMKAGKEYRDIIFPPTFFYPVGNMQMHAEPYIHLVNPLEKIDALKKLTYRPEAVAIHWWDGSWTLPDAWV